MADATDNETPRILEGVRVLDFTQYLAGPTVTRLMAELGADIVKVEQAPGGDPARYLPFSADGRSAYYVQQNRGKRSLCLDYEQLKAINPRLVMASISAFGRRNSPLSHKVGFDTIAQAFSGFMHMTGERDRPPQFVGVGFADVSAGVHALTGLALALYHRERTGQGQWVDISMIDCLYHAHEMNVQFPSKNPRVDPKRSGSHGGIGFPAGCFKGPEGYIVILALDRQWPNFCQAIGRPDLLDDPRYATARNRAKAKEELIELTEAWMAGLGTDQAVLDALEANRVPCAPVMTPRQTLEHPYFREREMVRVVPDPILGDVTIPGFPFKFSGRPDLPELFAASLGEHNTDVLTGWAGYDPARIADLQSSGLLFSRDRD